MRASDQLFVERGCAKVMRSHCAISPGVARWSGPVRCLEHRAGPLFLPDRRVAHQVLPMLRQDLPEDGARFAHANASGLDLNPLTSTSFLLHTIGALVGDDLQPPRRSLQGGRSFYATPSGHLAELL